MKQMKSVLLLAALVPFTALTGHAALVSTINPLGRTLGGTTTGGNFISAADFQTLITTAGDTAIAGVFDAESPTSGTLNVVETNYSAAGITLTGTSRYGRNDNLPVTAMTSGTKVGFVSVSETWTLGSKAAGTVISEFGVVFSNQATTTHLISATATFTDNTTAVYTSPTTDAAPGTGTFEFVGFRAPAGLGIKSLAITEPSGGAFLAYDDISYKVSSVPEPTTAALGLLTLGILGGGLRRRRD
jgi:hypothetical protein